MLTTPNDQAKSVVTPLTKKTSFLALLLMIAGVLMPLSSAGSENSASVTPRYEKSPGDKHSTMMLHGGAMPPSGFPLVSGNRAAPIVVDSNSAEVVHVVAEMLASDIEMVSGLKPEVKRTVAKPDSPLVILGTLGSKGLVDDLIKRGKLKTDGIKGQWESFLVQVVSDPFPGVPSALVVVGSDRRGTAYGALSISERIGVSPWIWWADVPPKPMKTIILSGGMTQGPPSVKYRGIFINDEDWGLKPWAAKTFEPEKNDIGPKTYAKICELLLRLRGNYLWPAMHECTGAFNQHPENKLVADRCAIVMGSSHCEQMLRNNVSEWPKDRKEAWNPVTNLPEILDYWEQRVRDNGGYENVYTVGMRGIHDGAVPGGGSIPEKRETLMKIIGLQRDMLSRNVNADPAKIPQIFIPYKEVLDVYKSGLKVPEDITIVWPDDNFGYIRQLPGEAERKRPGGSGVYYHISYLGRPHDYLWVDSTAPALIWHELNKAYELGARRLWVLNVGDIKPMETGMTLFFQMAWNARRYGPDVQGKFLEEFHASQFGSSYSRPIADIKDEYYRLCAIRRPEHLGFNRTFPKTPVQDSEWSHGPENDEAGRILGRWESLGKRAEALGKELPEEYRDAYFQLVEYPVCSGAAMAEKMILAEKARLTGSAELAHRSEAAYKRIGDLTDRFNSLKGGKWRGIISANPVNRAVFAMPPTALRNDAGSSASTSSSDELIVISPDRFTRLQDRSGTGWRLIEGLGPRGRAIAMHPQKDRPTLRTPEQIRDSAPFAEYRLQIPRSESYDIMIEALPTHPLTLNHEVMAAVSIDEGDPVPVAFDHGKDDEDDPTWQANVLRGWMSGKTTLKLNSGQRILRLWGADPTAVIERVTVKPSTGR